MENKGEKDIHHLPRLLLLLFEKQLMRPLLEVRDRVSHKNLNEVNQRAELNLGLSSLLEASEAG